MKGLRLPDHLQNRRAVHHESACLAHALAALPAFPGTYNAADGACELIDKQYPTPAAWIVKACRRVEATRDNDADRNNAGNKNEITLVHFIFLQGGSAQHVCAPIHGSSKRWGSGEEFAMPG
jgi:hypothetical protein